MYKCISPQGTEVALKKSRCSLNVKRSLLRHEARILQLLRDHVSIPKVYAYGHLDHFEYLSLELLGKSVRDVVKSDGETKPAKALTEETVIRILLQTVRMRLVYSRYSSPSIADTVVSQQLEALRHVHSSGLVHRDVSTRNILRSAQDPTVIKLIDFGITAPFPLGDPHAQPHRYNPLEEDREITGTLAFASLNSHDGVGT